MSFFFLCIWAIKDAWFPSDKVLKKHPREIVSSFEMAGQLAKIHVEEGDFVKENSVMAELSSMELEAELSEKRRHMQKNANQFKYSNLLLKMGFRMGLQKHRLMICEITKIQAEEKIEELHNTVNSLKDRQEKTELIAEKNGTVLNVYVGERIQIEAGDPIIKIHPQDNFYVFNQSLAIFSFLPLFFLRVSLFGN